MLINSVSAGGPTRPREEDQPGKPEMEKVKRQRIGEPERQGVGVREAVTETIKIGRKELKYGVVSGGTPFLDWVVPTGGVLCWSWDTK